MVQTIFLLMALLVAGFLGTRIAAFLRLPHSVFLVVVGVAAGALARKHGAAYFVSFEGMFPDVILFVLLPLLVFEASFGLDTEQLRRDVTPIAALSIVALAASTFLIGYAFHWTLGFELLPSLTFGALISATDPVAVVSLFKEVGAPKRLTHLIEAESLLNDGTAIVLFRTLLALTATAAVGAGTIGMAAGSFVQVAAVGILTGLVVAVASRLLLRFTAASGGAQVGITVAAAYLSYLIADVTLHASGVIATMAAGVFLGRTARLGSNKAAATGIRQLWEFLALSANIIVFFAVGFSVNPRLLVEGFSYLPLTVVIVYVARALSVYTTIPLINRLRLAEPISGAYQTVLVWGGLRGGLALGLVLTLPLTFPHRDVFVVVAIAVVMSTLLLNAMTTTSVLRLLKLDRMNQDEEALFERAMTFIHGLVAAPLRRAVAAGSLSQRTVEAQLGPAPPILGGQGAEPPAPAEGDLKFDLSVLLLAEQRLYDELLRDAVLSRRAYVLLARTVSDRVDRLQRQGVVRLRRYHFAQAKDSRWRRHVDALLRRLTPNAMLHRLTRRLEVLLNLQQALAKNARIPISQEAQRIRRIWRQRVRKQLETFFRTYPHYDGAVQAFFVSDTIRAQSERYIASLFEAGLINQTVAAQARTKISASNRKAHDDAWELLRPSPAYLLARVPPFRLIPRVGVRKAADLARRRVVGAGQTVVRAGERSGVFYLVIAGTLEVHPGKRRLFTGDTFGEEALLHGRPHAETVVAIATSELLEVDQRTFKQILDEYPSILRSGDTRLDPNSP